MAVALATVVLYRRLAISDAIDERKSLTPLTVSEQLAIAGQLAPHSSANACAGAIRDIPTRSPMNRDAENIPPLVPGAGDALARAFVECLSGYLKIDTSEDSGGEKRAVDFIGEILSHFGIRFEIVSDQGHQNLFAKIPCERADCASLVLYHHLDVVPADAGQWPQNRGPFSGAVQREPWGQKPELFVWGRGALDMKSIGIMQLISFVLAEKTKGKRQRNIYFLAGSDEERGSLGAKALMSRLAQEKSLSRYPRQNLLLNEGGYLAVPKRARAIHSVSVAERGGAWMELRARDPQDLLELLSRDLGLVRPGRAALTNLLAHCHGLALKTESTRFNVSSHRAIVRFKCKASDPTTTNLIKEVKEALAADRGISAVEASITTTHSGEQEISLSELHGGWHAADHSSGAIDVAIRLAQNIFSRRQVREGEDRLGATRAQDLGAFVFHCQRPRDLSLPSSQMASALCSACRISGLKIDGVENVARLDCRLGPEYSGKQSDHAAEFLNQLNPYFLRRNVRANLIRGWNFTMSRDRDAAYVAMVRAIQDQDPEAKIQSVMIQQGTDSAVFREPRRYGIDAVELPSYGFFPARIPRHLWETVHGKNERFPVSQSRPAMVAYFGLVYRLMMDAPVQD